MTHPDLFGGETPTGEGSEREQRSGVEAHAVNNREDQWTVSCPECEDIFDCSGYFEPADPYHCDCGYTFHANRLIFENGTVIE